MTAFTFRPALLEHRARAMEVLDSAGYVWLRSFSSIDLDHEDNFMEVCGIQDCETAQAIGRVIGKSFRGCRCFVRNEDDGIEHGWAVEVYLP